MADVGCRSDCDVRLYIDVDVCRVINFGRSRVIAGCRSFVNRNNVLVRCSNCGCYGDAQAQISMGYLSGSLCSNVAGFRRLGNIEMKFGFQCSFGYSVFGVSGTFRRVLCNRIGRWHVGGVRFSLMLDWSSYFEIDGFVRTKTADDGWTLSTSNMKRFVGYGYRKWCIDIVQTPVIVSCKGGSMKATKYGLKQYPVAFVDPRFAIDDKRRVDNVEKLSTAT